MDRDDENYVSLEEQEQMDYILDYDEDKEEAQDNHYSYNSAYEPREKPLTI